MHVIKIGTACLFGTTGFPNERHVQRLARELEANNEASILVVSGAIAYGKFNAQDKRPNKDIRSVELQSYSGRGQIELMRLYQSLFKKSQVGQLLITDDELKHSNHIRELIEFNQSKGIHTLINYNDTIDFNELRKDNDTLAAKIAIYCNADHLIILGNYDGFLDNQKKLIRELNHVEDYHYQLCKGNGAYGNGGFRTKLEAASLMLTAGKETIIGNIAYNIDDLIKGKVQRTIIRPELNVPSEPYEELLKR